MAEHLPTTDRDPEEGEEGDENIEDEDEDENGNEDEDRDDQEENENEGDAPPSLEDGWFWEMSTNNGIHYTNKRILSKEHTVNSHSEEKETNIRWVWLPKNLFRLVPSTHLMSEKEWRNIGIQGGPGWYHARTGRHSSYLCFQRSIHHHQHGEISKQ